MRLFASLPVLVLLSTACGDDGGRTTATTTTGVTMTANSLSAASDESTVSATGDAPTSGTTTAASEPGTSTPTSDGSSAAESSSGALKFDIGGETGEITTGAADQGCKKVDFLFVIDNSASMEDNQKALIASFPGFIASIKDTLSASSDYHIMVVDTDDDGRCKKPCDVNSTDYKDFCAVVKPNACNAKLDVCDTTRGAGVVHPVGLYSSNVACPITGGSRYMLPEEPDLPGTFACVATVGTAGNPSERPMNGMTEALTPAINGPGGCNEGFLRDDAILVILFISDDPNFEDEDKPQDWYDAVLASKKGNKDAIVVAGLIPEDGIACTGKPVPADQINGAHWAEFITLWGDHGLRGSICEMDYAPFFMQAVGIIDEACDNFQPPG